MTNPTIPEHEAQGSILQKYKELRGGFSSPVVPIFFTYIAPYEDYFLYIANQIIENARNRKFQTLVSETGSEVLPLIHATLPPSTRYKEWIMKYSPSPSFYHFKKDNEYIFRMNIALTFVFIALREAVKGWAVAAKKLPGNGGVTLTGQSPFKENNKLYESTITASDIMFNSSLAISSQPNTVEINLLKEFLRLCNEDFGSFVKTEEFLVMRVGLERLVLLSIPLLPHPLFSPINQTLKLVTKYRSFPDLLYLLCDEFPTLIMKRMIFSAYMLGK